MEFIFWLLFVGIFIAMLQDLKRREVDNWLNLLLVFCGWGFLIFRAIFEKDVQLIFVSVSCFILMFVLANLFYYGRVFSGGDAKLLFAMFAAFVGAGFYLTMLNVAVFIVLLLVSGAVYGLFYMCFLVFRDFNKMKKGIYEEFGRGYVKLGIFVSLIIIVGGFFIEFFMPLGILLLFMSVAFPFIKSIEKDSMMHLVNPKSLRLGDLLAKDVKIGNKTIKSKWEGISEEELVALKKSKKKIMIKEGIPFVPAFFIAFIAYVLLRGKIIAFVTSFI